MQSAAAAESRPLFGGALSAAFPRGAKDASELREIPDNQEVFAHERTDQSLIVELVEHQAQVADRDAARYHFEDIAGSNEASEPGSGFEVTGEARVCESELLLLADCASAWTLSGTQRVSKFNEEARNTVTLHLAVLRLPRFSTDVLITFNDPQRIDPESSSAAAAEEKEEEEKEEKEEEEEEARSGDRWTEQDFRRLLRTLTLHNPGLFG